jgi:flavin-dependent dehydrogenase
MSRSTPLESRYDAVIVGARVAGASTALLLARQGLRVLAVDRSPYGLDTTSTHAIMRPGVMQLHRWGVLDRLIAAGTPAIRRTTFHYGDEAVEVPIKMRDGLDALYAPRRTLLDATLVDAAREAGATVRHGVSFVNLVHDVGRVRGVTLDTPEGPVTVASNVVIGADGTRSGVARAAGAPVLHARRRSGAVLYGYVRGLDLAWTHWYYGPGVAAGAIPTNAGETCVFVAMPAERQAAWPAADSNRLFRDVMAENDPELAAMVTRAEPAGRLHSFAGRPGFIRKSHGPGWALVGDAGCFKDPITAHGITDALRDAELLANAILAGTDSALADYQATRDQLAIEFLDVSDEIASYDWDFDSVKNLHQRLSEIMGREYELVMELETAGVRR